METNLLLLFIPIKILHLEGIEINRLFQEKKIAIN